MAGSFLLSGSNYLSIASALGLTTTPVFVAFWGKPASLSGVGVSIQSTGGAGNGYQLGISGTSVAALTNLSASATQAGLVANTWQLYGGIFTSATSRQAVLNAVVSTVNSTSATTSGINEILIGGTKNVSLVFGNPWLGLIGGVLLLNVIPTQAQINQLAAGVDPRSIFTTGQIAAYWIGDSLTDVVNGNVLTNNGSVILGNADMPPVFGIGQAWSLNIPYSLQFATRTTHVAKPYRSGQVSATKSYVTKTTSGSGVDLCTEASGGQQLKWVFDPPAASITIPSGTAFFANVWASENSAATNAGVGCSINAYANGSLVTTIANGTFATELGTSLAACNFSFSAGSTVVVTASEQLMAEMYVVAAGGTKAVGTVTLSVGGTINGATGDSWINMGMSLNLTPYTLDWNVQDIGAAQYPNLLEYTDAAGTTACVAFGDNVLNWGDFSGLNHAFTANSTAGAQMVFDGGTGAPAGHIGGATGSAINANSQFMEANFNFGSSQAIGHFTIAKKLTVLADTVANATSPYAVPITMLSGGSGYDLTGNSTTGSLQVFDGSWKDSKIIMPTHYALTGWACGTDNCQIVCQNEIQTVSALTLLSGVSLTIGGDPDPNYGICGPILWNGVIAGRKPTAAEITETQRLTGVLGAIFETSSKYALVTGFTSHSADLQAGNQQGWNLILSLPANTARYNIAQAGAIIGATTVPGFAIISSIFATQIQPILTKLHNDGCKAIFVFDDWDCNGMAYGGHSSADAFTSLSSIGTQIVTGMSGSALALVFTTQGPRADNVTNFNNLRTGFHGFASGSFSTSTGISGVYAANAGVKSATGFDYMVDKYADANMGPNGAYTDNTYWFAVSAGGDGIHQRPAGHAAMASRYYQPLLNKLTASNKTPLVLLTGRAA